MQPPRIHSRSFSLALAGAMASSNAKTVDIKLSFPQTDMVPGPLGLEFQRDLLSHGCKADARGYSWADHYLRQDEGAVDAAGNPMPGAPPMPAAGAAAQLRESQAAYRGRKKDSFRFLIAHIADKATLTLLGDVNGPYFQDGAAAYDYVIPQIITAILASQIEEMNIEWYLTEIHTDVGVGPNSIKDSLKLLRLKNALRPAAKQASSDDIAEKLLNMISNASSMFTYAAQAELNAVEGVPGTPGVRQFQLPVPNAAAIAAGAAAVPAVVVPPLPRPRDLNALVTHFHGLWENAVRKKQPGFAVAAPLGARQIPAARQHVARGAAEVAMSGGELSDGISLALPPPRHGSPSRTLGELTAAGYSLQRGTVTTSDFRTVSQDSLMMASEDGAGDSYCVEISYDANDVLSIELICNRCRGIGHPERLCPSAKKFRSFDHAIELLTNAKNRAETRGSAQGHAAGGRRPMPRGQAAPFKQTPRRFSSNAPFRRFQSARPPARARSAGEEDLDEPPELEERSETESGGGLRETQSAPAETLRTVTVPPIRTVIASQGMPTSATAFQGRDAGPQTPLTFSMTSSGSSSVPSAISEAGFYESGHGMFEIPKRDGPEDSAADAPAQGSEEPSTPSESSHAAPSESSHALAIEEEEQAAGQPVSSVSGAPDPVSTAPGSFSRACADYPDGLSRADYPDGSNVELYVDPPAGYNLMYASRSWARMCAWGVCIIAAALLALSSFLDAEANAADETDQDIATGGYFCSASLAQAAGVAGLTGMVLRKADAVIGAARDVLAHGMNELLVGRASLVVLILVSGMYLRLAGASELSCTADPSEKSIIFWEESHVAPPSRVFTEVVDLKGLETVYDLRSNQEIQDEYSEEKGYYLWCFDSGCSTIAIPEEDAWMIDTVTDTNPDVAVEVASGSRLLVVVIGMINDKRQTIGVDSFRLHPDKSEEPTVSFPRMSRVLVTRGLKKGIRLAGVGPLKKMDGIFTYFNDDNSAGIDDCVRFPDGHYARFVGSRHELPFIATDKVKVVGSANETSVANVGHQTLNQAPRHVDSDNQVAAMSPLTMHAALGHVYDARIRSSDLLVGGVVLSNFTFDAAGCRGCRLGKTHRPPSLQSSAPSRGGSRPHREDGMKRPSTHGYTYFGQRIDTDMSTTMPASWPHGFTVMTNFCDRYTAEFFLYFQVQASAYEVAGALTEFERRCKHRLKDGVISRWHNDNDTAFDGPEVKAVAAELVDKHSRTVAHEKNRNPVSERNFGVLEGGLRAAHAFADAPLCLWPWGAYHLECVLYYIETQAHQPPTSPYRFSQPDAGTANLSWVRAPIYCDVTVHLPPRDVMGKISPTGADGCYLGHDFKRNCEFVYLSGLRRLGSFVVTAWQPTSFTVCKSITADTPVEYHQVDDLRFGPPTGELLPKNFRRGADASAMAAKKKGVSQARTSAKKAPNKAPKKKGVSKDQSEESLLAEKAMLVENARRIDAGVKLLEKEGAESVDACVRAQQEEQRDEARQLTATGLERAYLAADERLLFGDAGAGETEVEINIECATEAARKVAEQFGIPKIKTVDEAMKSPFWPLLKEAMEEEITGKLGNKAWKLVLRGDKRILKSKWVFDFKLLDDGTIKRVKARFVGCGYSQIADLDYDKCYASTLPGMCFRLWCSIVADERLITDSIDAVKAFTQADVDRELFVEQPIGFVVPGYCLQLLKALEGIRQGAYLWFQKNKWAWNKCGMFADLVEPNLYTHETLTIVAAVFADDVGAAFSHDARAAYLLIREAYGKLINIDSPGPETIVPVTKFTGVNVKVDNNAGTVAISMESYLAKLRDRHKDVPIVDFPTAKSKVKRMEWDNMTAGDPSTAVDKQEFMETLGEIAWPITMVWVELAVYASRLGSFVASPQREHQDGIYLLMGYMFSDPSKPIIYGGPLKIPLGLDAMPDFFIESKGLFGASDSSWGTRARPQGGHVVMRTNAAIQWSSKSLKIVADSSAHAETAESSRCVKTLTFSKMVLSGAKRPTVGPSTVLGDNSAMHDMVVKEGSSSKSRHFERSTIFVKYMVMRMMVVCKLVSTVHMIADIFTKATDVDTFTRMRDSMRNIAEPVLRVGLPYTFARWAMSMFHLSVWRAGATSE